EPRPIREIIPETPEWLCDIIGRLHVKDPDKRYQTASEVSADLDRSLRQYQQDGVVTGVVKPAWEAETVVTKVEKPKPGGGWFNTLLWLGAVCLFLVALIFVAASNLFNPPSVNNAVTNSTTDVAPNPPSSPALPGWQGWPIDAPPPAIAPFTAEEAKMYQVAWATYLGVPVEYTNSIGMKFRLIPPGEFLMGKTPEEVGAGLRSAGEDAHWRERAQAEGPQHKVVLTQPFYLSAMEVTQSQYAEVAGVNPSNFSVDNAGGELVANLETGNLPVETVSWNDATEFCDSLSERSNLIPFYVKLARKDFPYQQNGYRLPTEAEWEWACRAGTITRFFPGNSAEDLSTVAWFNSNSEQHTHPVGRLNTNPFGLSDVHGNVWEWVQDSWNSTFYSEFATKPAIDPMHPPADGLPQVIRGGNWNNNHDACHSSHRTFHQPTDRHGNIGFRVALPVDAVKESLQSNLTESSSNELFNGKDLTGWRMHPDAPGSWRVENGELVSDGKPSYLFSERNDFGDFELTCEVSISDGGDSGLIVRSPFEKVGPNGLPGYEAQIQAGEVLTAGWATGAIAQSGANTGWSLKQSSGISVPPNEYFTLKVRVAHNRVKTYVNGVQVAEYVDPAWTYQRGHIALQHSGASTVIKFRKIALTELVPERSTTPTANFALQFDGVDDYVEWSELPVPQDRPVRIELAATVDSIQADAEFGIPIFNWGGAVAVGAAADPNIGDVLAVRFLSNSGVHHTWHIRNVVEDGRRFSLVVDYRDGVATFSVDGRPVPASQLRYVLHRDGESIFDVQPENFRLFSDMKRSFLATPSTHPDQKSMALHGKVHHLKLTQDTGDTIVEFDFTQDSGNTLHDLSGNGHNGNIVGAKWVRTDGTPAPSPPPQLALQFDGVDDYVEWSNLPLPQGEPFKVELAGTIHDVPAELDRIHTLFNWGRALVVNVARSAAGRPIVDVQFNAGSTLHQFAIDNGPQVGEEFMLSVEH
ncbi:MAG: SUMF1/EgtB/PvdO family nonheme iron enzyme, partial [Planctomycetaceae bacterium]|nr:SUMF1/EgtB/PvdO family nonheme iron enzyme [Planctomycetaceae bacterium]